MGDELFDAFVSDEKTGNRALFISKDDGLLCVHSDFDAFVVGTVYSGDDILDTEV